MSTAKLTTCPDWCDGHQADELPRLEARTTSFHHDKTLWDGGKHGQVIVAQYVPAAGEEADPELPFVDCWFHDSARIGQEGMRAASEALGVAVGLVDGLRALTPDPTA
ncbi:MULTISPECIES: hypothetical protein [unclassified Luteococcus]|uniref:hypothetical protein n=1 Tax=unclassified Luteococcus TaxID=2639923 RepID=UPI00313B0BA1